MSLANLIGNTADAEIGLMSQPSYSAQTALETAIEVLEEFYPEESLVIMTLTETLDSISQAIKNGEGGEDDF